MTLSVEAYDGPSSPGDPPYVLFTFEPVASATSYRIWREIEVNYAMLARRMAPILSPRGEGGLSMLHLLWSN